MNLSLIVFILPLTILIEGRVYKLKLINNPYRVSTSLNIISTIAMLILHLIPDYFLDNYGIALPTPKSIFMTINLFPEDDLTDIFFWLGPLLVVFYALSALFAVGLEKVFSKLLYRYFRVKIPLAAIIKANLISATLTLAYFYQYFSVGGV